MSNLSNLTTESGSCSPYASDHYVAVAILAACTGGVSAAASLLVVFGILISKKYLFFIQRLILYLSVAVFLNSLSVVLRLQRVAALGGGQDESLHPLCVFTAFADQTTSWSTLIAISCISCCLLLNVVLLRPMESLEKLYVVLIFVFPLTFNWIPFINNYYGEAGAWCWIRNQDENCQSVKFGNHLRFIFWYIPLYVFLVVVLIMYFYILYRVRKLSRQWEGKFDPASKVAKSKMVKEFRPLIWYPLIYLIWGIFPTMNRIHGAFSDEPSLTLWILHAFFSPLRGGFIALAYALDGQTVRRLLRDRCAIFRRCKSHVTEYPAARGHSDSFAFPSNKSEQNTNFSSDSWVAPQDTGEVKATKGVALSVVEEEDSSASQTSPVANGTLPYTEGVKATEDVALSVVEEKDV